MQMQHIDFRIVGTESGFESMYTIKSSIASLALTVPSWTDSLQRTQKNTDFSKISERARWRLVYELDHLLFTADGLLSALKEEH